MFGRKSRESENIKKFELLGSVAASNGTSFVKIQYPIQKLGLVICLRDFMGVF